MAQTQTADRRAVLDELADGILAERAVEAEATRAKAAAEKAEATRRTEARAKARAEQKLYLENVAKAEAFFGEFVKATKAATRHLHEMGKCATLAGHRLGPFGFPAFAVRLGQYLAPGLAAVAQNPAKLGLIELHYNGRPSRSWVAAEAAALGSLTEKENPDDK